MVLPQHIAIICDGNRRWAKQKGWLPFRGHQYAVDHVFEEIINTAKKLHIPYLTFWIFSTENWNRDRVEVDGLMMLFRKFFDSKVEQLGKEGVRFCLLGDINKFEPDIQERITQAKEKTAHNTEITVCLAMNYGGRDELLRATRKIAQQVATGVINSEDITEQTITDNLDTTGVPDPDMIVRTSGEHRLSGFLPWQSVYSELFFVPFHFPEFTGQHLLNLLEEFANRHRRFGK